MQTEEKLGLEDHYIDVLNKARRGLQLSIETLAERSGLSVTYLQALYDETLPSDEVDSQTIEKLAFILNLHAPTLIQMKQNSWYPQTASINGLAMFTTWYGDMTVNAYLVWDPQTLEAASFDTGSTSEPMLAYLKANQLTLKQIFITHTHQDHLADLAKLQSETEAVGYGSAVDNPLGLKPLQEGDGLVLGSLKIRILGTSGHTPGGLSYFIQGLERPIVVVGDALFASSMGGAPLAYKDALYNNQHKILALPDNTIICPGHGPLTSVGEEKVHNPFFPELK